MKESPSFCLLPWVSMAIRNNGQYRVCCNANTSEGRGLLKNESEISLNAGDVGLDEARNSETLKQIRLSMLQSQWPKSCQRCQKEEKSGIRSKRLFTRDLLPTNLSQEWAEKITAADGTLDLTQSPLLDLDIRFGNKCNLACRMCGPSDSSLWEIDFQKMGGVLNLERFDWYENEAFWRSLYENSTQLQHIYIVGGEPLLIERHYEFLRYLVDSKKAARVVLEYNTNLTVLPDKALTLWSHFAKVRVGVSFDGIGPFNDYIRHPSRFSVLEKNLERLDQAPGQIQAWLACTISVYNLHHLVDIMRWVHAKNFKRIGRSKGKEFFVPHPVHKPDHLNIQILDPNTKAIYAAHLRADLDRFFKEAVLTESARQKARETIEKYIHFMTAKDSHEYWERFKDYTERLDKIRNQSVFALKPLFQF